MSESKALSGPFSKSVLSRFEKHVWPEALSGCWLWDAGLDDHGYGILWVGDRAERAHRLSHAIHVGPVPAGKIVLHRCDNPPCVNPAHLSVGTHLDNVADCVVKGRAAAKLTAAAVCELRVRYREGELATALAREYGVSERGARNAIFGVTWARVTDVPPVATGRGLDRMRWAS